MKRTSLLTIAFVATGIIIIAFRSVTGKIQLDGVIRDDEWKDAKQYSLSDGGKLLVKKVNNELYLALSGEKRAWAHVYLLHRDTVRVLHASAALGEAKYVRKDDLWRVIQSFRWDMRDRIYNDELAKKQEECYKKNGWVANNNNMGNGMSFEFRLDLSRTDNNPARFACVLIQEPLTLHYFPVSLNDNTILHRLVQGYTPDSLQFHPATWEKLP